MQLTVALLTVTITLTQLSIFYCNSAIHVFNWSLLYNKYLKNQWLMQQLNVTKLLESQGNEKCRNLSGSKRNTLPHRELASKTLAMTWLKRFVMCAFVHRMSGLYGAMWTELTFLRGSHLYVWFVRLSKETDLMPWLVKKFKL